MDALFTFQEELKSETKNLYQEIRKNSAQHDSYNRLHSIQHDIAFVRKVAEEWYDSEFKVVANQRCGSWYTDPEVSRTTPVVAMPRKFHYSLTMSWSFTWPDIVGPFDELIDLCLLQVHRRSYQRLGL